MKARFYFSDIRDFSYTSRHVLFIYLFYFYFLFFENGRKINRKTDIHSNCHGFCQFRGPMVDLIRQRHLEGRLEQQQFLFYHPRFRRASRARAFHFVNIN